MSRFNQILIAALMVQIVTVGGIYFASQPPAAERLHTTLLETDKDVVNRITIDEGDEKQTVLSKVDGNWLLPEYHQMRANQNKVNAFFSRLETTEIGWPVATTSSSRS